MTTHALSTTTRDGVNLRYLDVGSGDPPLVFIHGWCCDHSFWAPQVQAFSANHRVVSVDLRGHGKSDKPDQDYAIDGFANDVMWLCRELDIERPVIIGHSMGGVIALNIARRQPAMARALVFVDAGITPLPEHLRPVLAQTIEGLRSPDYRRVASSIVKDFMFRSESPEELRDVVAGRMAAAPQRVMHTALASTLSDENCPPGPLPVPSLFVRAATFLGTEDELRQRYPGLEVVEVDAAHFLHMEKPAEFNSILRRFLEELR